MNLEEIEATKKRGVSYTPERPSCAKSMKTQPSTTEQSLLVIPRIFPSPSKPVTRNASKQTYSSKTSPKPKALDPANAHLSTPPPLTLLSELRSIGKTPTPEPSVVRPKKPRITKSTASYPHTTTTATPTYTITTTTAKPKSIVQQDGMYAKVSPRTCHFI